MEGYGWDEWTVSRGCFLHQFAGCYGRLGTLLFFNGNWSMRMVSFEQLFAGLKMYGIVTVGEPLAQTAA